MTSSDIDALIDCYIPIKIDVESKDTTVAAVPIIMKLEGPEGIIYNQIGLKKFFLSQNENSLYQYLPSQEDRRNLMGTAMIEFVLNPSISGEADILKFPLFSFLRKWIHGSFDGKAPSNFSLLTVNALSYIICASPSIVHLNQLMPHIQHFLAETNVCLNYIHLFNF